MLTCREKIIKREGKGCRECQQAHGKIMIQYQRAKGAVTLAVVARVGFIDTWLVDKNKGDNYVVISLWLVTSLIHCLVMAPTNLAFKGLLKMTNSLSPRCTVYLF